MLIDLYCLLSVGLLSCCSMLIEFPLSVRREQYSGQGKCLWMSWSVPPQWLFICALYPAGFLLFDLCSLFCPPHFVFLPLCYNAYVYFRNARQAFYVNCSPYCQDFSDLFSLLPPQLLRELLHEGQAISVGVSAESGRGGQWLARIRQLIKEGSVPDVSLVPVGISYDCVPNTNTQVDACKHTLASAHT